MKFNDHSCNIANSLFKSLNVPGGVLGAAAHDILPCEEKKTNFSSFPQRYRLSPAYGQDVKSSSKSGVFFSIKPRCAPNYHLTGSLTNIFLVGKLHGRWKRPVATKTEQEFLRKEEKNEKAARCESQQLGRAILKARQ